MSSGVLHGVLQAVCLEAANRFWFRIYDVNTTLKLPSHDKKCAQSKVKSFERSEADEVKVEVI